MLKFNPISESSAIIIENNIDVINNQSVSLYLQNDINLNAAQQLRLKRLCQDDFEFQIKFLISALKTGISDIFIRYIRWLKIVFINKGKNLTTIENDLKVIKKVLSCELSGKDLTTLLSMLKLAFEELENERIESVETYISKKSSEPVFHAKFCQALISNKREELNSIVQQGLERGLSIPEIHVDLIQPALYEIGRLWQLNQLTVADEHLATALVQNLLANIYAQTTFKAPLNKRVLLAAVDNNHHSVGLRMISDTFESEGWQVDYLGSNTPMPDLIEFIDANPVDLVGLSVSMFDQIPQLKQTVAQISVELGTNKPSLMIGGYPLNEMPELVKTINADIWVTDSKALGKEIERNEISEIFTD